MILQRRDIYLSKLDVNENAMQCNAMQCNAMQCNAMQCNATAPAMQLKPHLYLHN
jgi:hypothetical protein